MTAYITRRILFGIIVLLLVSILIFFLMRLVPGDPLLLYMSGSDVATINQDQLALLRHQYNLDKPLIEQYFIWMDHAFQGDLGRSISFLEPVSTLLIRRFPVTLNVGVWAFLISSFFGIAFGTICAIRRGKWADTFFSIIANFGITAPGFWIGILLIYAFAFKLHWLPTYGYTSPFTDLWMNLKMLIMPVFCLSIWMIAALTRQTRSSMLEVIHQDYIRTAWSKGLKERAIIFRHVIKNGLIPVVTTLGMQVNYLFGSAVLIEVVFNIPGMGRLIMDGILSTDYQVVQGAVLVVALIVILVNILVDIIYGLVDPRIRYE
jgi:peptide/nickel transport system permease protein